MEETKNERDSKKVQEENVCSNDISVNLNKDNNGESIADSKFTKSEVPTGTKEANKKKISKIKIGIACIIVAIIIIVSVVASMPSKFDEVHNECVQIVGVVGVGEGYFSISTNTDLYDGLPSSIRDEYLYKYQVRALEGIKYANEELGFPGVYEDMMHTNALMGRQTEENSKYKVSWTYHPDAGLNVTYSEKK